MVSADPRNPAALELLAAIRELRADLSRLRATDGLMALVAALAETEGEVSRTGAASLDRLLRLREELVAEQALLGVSASTSALAQALATLLDSSPWTDSTRPRPPAPGPGSHDAPRSAPPAGHTPPGPSPGSDDDEWPETDG
ncbi:hypothetical protein [Streptomyces sp. NPDC048825]|uniref:hypothetical protein n=1 Tax=Streptomyces sp. NPDC048825 TaxID=3365592 RepID=UPI00371624F6